jgi:NAD(P)-dependent dehydrogenase (short-subunit alcohol dehydrogenase family)
VDELRFDGRVAVVTGAGRGLGRAHAMLLAARGARVVVNDLGGEKEGTGADPGPAEQVVKEITDAGGEAVANAASVADPAGARSIVSDAIDAFGGIDIVVNNAGILTIDDFPTLPVDVFKRHLDVHLVGSFNVTQAAWPHLVERGYGRVMITISSGALGTAPAVSYSSAKGGLISLARSLAQLGAPDGIKVNVLCPTAFTRMVGDPTLRARAGVPQLGEREKEGRGQPEDVSPLVAFLVHESCPTTGEMFSMTGTNVGRLYIAETRGYTAARLTPEDIRDHWAEVNDEQGYWVPTSSADHAAMRTELSL